MKYKVLYASRYNFKNQETGELIQGSKITYLDSHPHNFPDRRGRPAMTLTCELDLFDKLPELPGEYDLEFSMRPDAKGRPVLSIVDIVA